MAWIRDEVGDRPFGVDLIVPARYAGDDDGGLTMADVAALIPGEHRDFLNDLLTRYEVPLDEDANDQESTWGSLGESVDAPFSANRAEEQLEIALSHQPALMANALGPPPPEMIEKCHEAGAKVAALAGSRVHAERNVNAGADLIIAQGAEAGGHTGEIGTMVLIPDVVDAVSPVPVLGAGGIGGGRQMAAAMALGAAGVWCGSVWLTTEEAETHPVVKQKMLEANTHDARCDLDGWNSTKELIVQHRSGSGAEKLALILLNCGIYESFTPLTQVVLEMVQNLLMLLRVLEIIRRLVL